jgi:hypothetical protein
VASRWSLPTGEQKYAEKSDVEGSDCLVRISGGTADQDEECAQAGLDAVKDALK